MTLRGTPVQRERGGLARRKRIPSSSLPLFVAGIRAHDEDDAAAPDDLALVANGLYGRSNFHDCLSSQKSLLAGLSLTAP